jgi:CheY-like chemotaxis protein
VTRAHGTGTAQLRFEVADTGIGIDPAEQHLLFRRFSQVGLSTHRRVGGTGLGLAISRHLVEAMGGAIGIDSRLGAGSTFWFTIPAAEMQSRAAAEASEPVAAAASPARILVAEDHQMIRELIEAMLRDAGHEVVLVNNGAEAVAAIEAGDFDLVLMDVQMPELDGLSATRRIREMGDRVRRIPIIALTAYAMAEGAKRCRAAGANEHLAKPIDREELLSLVAKWSGGGRAPFAPAPDAAAAPEVMDVAVLDGLEHRFGKDRVVVFAGQFRDQVNKAVDAIIATTDRQRIAEETHDLLSIAGTMGCNELMTRSRALMDRARRETSDLGPLVAELTTAADRALTAMLDRYSS